MKYLKIMVIASVFLPSVLNAQSLTVRDRAGNIVNNDTVVFTPGVIQKPPFIEIVCYLYAQNTGAGTMNLGVKKTELVLGAGVDHRICFGPVCYPSSVFISPVGEIVMHGDIDSTFSGHYRYESASHLPAADLLAYTFYNKDDPADSAIVYVVYNSIATDVNEAVTYAGDELKVFPNPASEVVNFQWRPVAGASVKLVVVNAVGQVVASRTVSDGEAHTSLNIESWPPGVYFYALSNGKQKLMGSVSVVH